MNHNALISDALEVPAFIDIHCHLREPGFEYKEDMTSGTAAAVAGGYGAVVCMPNTKPVIDNEDTLRYVIRRADETASCIVYPSAAITVGQRGDSPLCDFERLSALGAVAFTNDGRPVESADVMLEAMKRCAKKDYLIISHCEELSLAQGVINEGKISKKLGLAGIPNTAEDLMIARDILLAEQTGCRLHIAHVSTEGGLRIIREAKARGVRVTCETCPHYFTFTDEAVLTLGVNAKMNPPLRSAHDRQAVIKAIIDGTIDCISTDHAPHSEAEKAVGLEKAPNGIIGLQTAFASAVTFLVRPGHISLEKLIDLMSYAPARILGIPPCEKKITVFPDECFTFRSDMILSKSKNSPYVGMRLYGRVRGYEDTIG